MKNNKNTFDPNNIIFDLSEVVDFLSIYNEENEFSLNPIEKELFSIIKSWQYNIINTSEEIKIQISELLEIENLAENKEDKVYVHELNLALHKSKNKVFCKKINQLYNSLDTDLVSIIQEVKLNTSESRTNLFIFALIILLSDTKYGKNTNDNNTDSKQQKQSQWINDAINKIVKINQKVNKLQTLLGKNSFKNIFIKQLQLMTHEILAVLTATGCHILKEDCSVLMQSIKVKPQSNPDKNFKASFKKNNKLINEFIGKVRSYIDNVNEINNVNNSDEGKYFSSLSDYLGESLCKKEMQNEFYLYMPIILDAKDIVLYLNYLDKYLWKLINTLKGKTFKENCLNLTSSSVNQPRVKLDDPETRFNIRFDYNEKNKAVEMDMGGVAFQLKNNKFLPDVIGESIKIIGNSYKSGKDTNRIMHNPELEVEEQIAIVHSVLMIQGCDILGREPYNIFGYHYILQKNISKEDFKKIIDCFKL